MKTISVLVPVSDGTRWTRCRAAIESSIAASGAPSGVFEIVPAFDLARHGVSFVRNAALAASTGDWIAWVDDDDEVMPGWAAEIYANLSDIDEAASSPRQDRPVCDVLAFGASVARSDGSCVAVRPCKGRARDMPAAEFLIRCLKDLAGSTWLWNKVFRRSLFDGLSFEGATMEDFRIMPRLMVRARAVRVLPAILYRYVRPPDSLTHSGGGALNASGIADASRDGLRDIADAPGYKSILSAWRAGCAVRAADWLFNSKECNPVLARILRRNLASLVFDFRRPLRSKLKAILAAF